MLPFDTRKSCQCSRLNAEVAKLGNVCDIQSSKAWSHLYHEVTNKLIIYSFIKCLLLRHTP